MITLGVSLFGTLFDFITDIWSLYMELIEAMDVYGLILGVFLFAAIMRYLVIPAIGAPPLPLADVPRNSFRLGISAGDDVSRLSGPTLDAPGAYSDRLRLGGGDT